MTDRPRPAAGAQVLALGASMAATLALMAGMATAAPDSGSTTTSPGSSTTVIPGQPAPTTAPPTTSSHAS